MHTESHAAASKEAFLVYNIHLMSAPEGNGLFCFVLFCFVLFCFVLFCFVLFCFVFPRVSMFPETKSMEALRFEGKQN